MSANVETMFYESNEANGRFTPWHKQGLPVANALTSQEAITAAGLDWLVEKKPIFDAAGNQIPDYFANTRDKDNSILGIVSDRYEIVQNHEAFAFTDNLIDEGMKYVTAGSLRSGKCIWLLGELPSAKILGDDIGKFICFTNTFDGSGAIQCCMTPVRVCCNNTLNLALSTAKRKWSTRHIGDIQGKIHEAQIALGLANTYMSELNIECERLAEQKISDGEVESMLDMMYPVTEQTTERQKASIIKLKDNFFYCLGQDDIKKFKGTKYAVAMAATDFADHSEPARKTANFEANRWFNVMQGHQFVDAVYKQLAA